MKDDDDFDKAIGRIFKASLLVSIISVLLVLGMFGLVAWAIVQLVGWVTAT